MAHRTRTRSPLGGTRDDGSAVRRTVLPGGLRVVTEALPGARSAAVGVWFGVGSRDEGPGLAGATHFLEHLLFKGTSRRDAFAIAAEVEAVGGELNAFTTKECTCYHARVLAEDLPLALDVLGDMLTASLLDPEDVENERGVVLEEIAMHDDDPGDVVHDAFAAALWGDGPLGRPVTGTPDSVRALTREALVAHHEAAYRPGSSVVAVAGGVDHDTVVALVQDAFGDGRADGSAPAPLRASAPAVPTRPGLVVARRDTEQAHLVLGVPALRRGDPRRPALRVLDSALGAGPSSRLFQQVREERGLAYSVFSATDAHADTGALSVYAGCAPDSTREVLRLCRAVLEQVADDGLTDDEVRRAQGALRGSLLLGLEDTESRMTRLGRAELSRGEQVPVAQVLDELAAVTPDDVREVAREVLGRPPAVAVIGPFGHDEVQEWGTR